jgi:hypothetical protein
VIQNVPESAEKELVSDEMNHYPKVEKLLLEHIPGAQRAIISRDLILLEER